MKQKLKTEKIDKSTIITGGFNTLISSNQCRPVDKISKDIGDLCGTTTNLTKLTFIEHLPQQ